MYPAPHIDNSLDLPTEASVASAFWGPQVLINMIDSMIDTLGSYMIGSTSRLF